MEVCCSTQEGELNPAYPAGEKGELVDIQAALKLNPMWLMSCGMLVYFLRDETEVCLLLIKKQDSFEDCLTQLQLASILCP